MSAGGNVMRPQSISFQFIALIELIAWMDWLTQRQYYNSKYIDAEEKDVSRNQIDESIEWFDENEVVDSARYTVKAMNVCERYER